MVAAVMVLLLVAGLGYAFVTGLAYKYIKKANEELNVFDVNEPPPPPDEVPPPPPPPDTPVPPPPTEVFVPKTIVNVPQPPRAPVETSERPTTVLNNLPPAPPAPVVAPPPPPAPSQAKSASPRGRPQEWVTDDDYPSSALRSGAEGVVGFRLDVGADGRVSNCTVTSSSGNGQLDSTACSLLRRRARFTPAQDDAGNKIPGTYSSRIRWRIPNS